MRWLFKMIRHFLAFIKTRSATAQYTAKIASEIIFENIYSLVMDNSALNLPFIVQLP